MYSSIMFRFLSPLNALPMDENRAETASDTGMTPPDDIEMDIRNAITDMISPNNTIRTNLFFFLVISEPS